MTNLSKFYIPKTLKLEKPSESRWEGIERERECGISMELNCQPRNGKWNQDQNGIKAEWWQKRTWSGNSLSLPAVRPRSLPLTLSVRGAAWPAAARDGQGQTRGRGGIGEPIIWWPKNPFFSFNASSHLLPHQSTSEIRSAYIAHGSGFAPKLD